MVITSRLSRLSLTAAYWRSGLVSTSSSTEARWEGEQQALSITVTEERPSFCSNNSVSLAIAVTSDCEIEILHCSLRLSWQSCNRLPIIFLEAATNCCKNSHKQHRQQMW